uniref:Elongator complex protein 4 n=1 Tax=Psilocybe cubensis TaxID=181762 RepID=A0A8H7Y5H6_PSICU
MSSFKRKATGKQTLTVYPGTRISPASNLSLITSTGISSLDDILGGGLPLTCSLVFGAPDIHSSYGDLIQKYFVAQGLGNGHRVCVVGEDAEKFVRDIMWFPKAQELQRAAESDDDDKPANQDEKVKIAWRYEKMKQFQTTVGSQDGDCLPFELASRVPKEMIDDGLKSQRIRVVNAGTNMFDILGEISRFLEAETKEATRICIAGLGSAGWGDVSPQRVLYFLHTLRGILRRHGHGCGSVSLAAHVSTDRWGGTGWMDRVGWSADGAVTISAFTGVEPGPSKHISVASWTGECAASAVTADAECAERAVLDAAGTGKQRGKQSGIQVHTKAAGV